MRNQHLPKARLTRLEKAMTDLLKIYQELQEKKWVNLSHQIKEDSPHFPALPALEKKDIFHFERRFSCSAVFCSWPVTGLILSSDSLCGGRSLVGRGLS